MRVLKFYTKSIKTDKVERIVWYINEITPRSSIIKRVENYSRINQLICIMDVAQLYRDRSDFDKEEKGKGYCVPKNKLEYLIIGEA